MIERTQFGDVLRLRMSSWQSRAFGYDSSAYVVRGVMIDAGPWHVRHELLGGAVTRLTDAAAAHRVARQALDVRAHVVGRQPFDGARRRVRQARGARSGSDTREPRDRQRGRSTKRHLEKDSAHDGVSSEC